jgi:hypothetical protein
MNNAGCNRGNCTTYFSLSEGDRVEHCEDGVSLLCESTICYKNYCLSSAVKNDQPTPTPCKSSADCVSSHYTSSLWSLPLYKDCECNYAGQGYCALFPGDKPFKKYMERMYYWINGKRIHLCHTMRRFSEDCMKDVRAQRYSRSHLKAYYRVYHYPQLQQLSSCAREMFEPKAVLDAGVHLGLVVGLMGLLI